MKSPVGKFSLSKFQAVAIKSIPSVKKFDLVLKQLQVVLSKLFHTARLSKYTLSKLPTSKDKLDPLATFARSPSAFAEVFLPQHLVLFPASRSAFEVFPQARKRSKEISPRISRSVKSSRSFQAEKKRSLPVKASGVSPKKIEVEVHHICQEKLASGVKFQNQIMKSVRSPWVHGSEVTKTNEVRGSTIEVKNTAVRRQRS